MVYLCRVDFVRKVWSDEFGRMLLDGRLFVGRIGGNVVKKTVSEGSSAVLVSSLSRLSEPRLSPRTRNASFSGISRDNKDFEAGSASNVSRKQHPPPQQTFSISFVFASPLPTSILRTSSGPCDIQTVEAHLVRGLVGRIVNVFSSLKGSNAPSICGSVPGVANASESDDELVL